MCQRIFHNKVHFGQKKCPVADKVDKVEVLEYIRLHLLSEGHLSGIDGIGQNVRKLESSQTECCSRAAMYF